MGAGKVREIGVCNYAGDALLDLLGTAQAMGVGPVVSEQSALSLLQRKALDDVLPMCDEHGLAFVPYHPLASGMLTGKYVRGEAAPAGTRFAEQLDDATRSRLMSDRAFARVDALTAYAAEHGRTLLELAFGWIAQAPVGGDRHRRRRKARPGRGQRVRCRVGHDAGRGRRRDPGRRVVG